MKTIFYIFLGSAIARTAMKNFVAWQEAGGTFIAY
jgi:hypothetical protein